MIRKLIKRTARVGVAAAKFAVQEVRERIDKSGSRPNANTPANRDHADVPAGSAFEEVTPAPTISVDDMRPLLEAGSIVLLDCRDQHEWEAGYIGPCVHIPMDEIESRVSELDKTKTTVVYCLHGVRSAEVATWLSHLQHFDDARSLDGGIVAWYSEYDQDRIVVTRNEDH